MGRKKGGKKKSPQQVAQQRPKKAAKPTLSPEQLALQKKISAHDATSNPYTAILYRKIRSLNKRLGKLEKLEEIPFEDLNNDQKRTLSEKPVLLQKRALLQEIQNDLTAVALQERESQEEPMLNIPDENTIKQSAIEVEDELASSPLVTTDSDIVHVQAPEPALAPTEQVVLDLLSLLHVNNLWRANDPDSVQNTLDQLHAQNYPLTPEDLAGIRTFASAIAGYSWNPNAQATPTDTLKDSVDCAMKYLTQGEHQVLENLSSAKIHEVLQSLFSDY